MRLPPANLPITPNGTVFPGEQTNEEQL